MSETRPTDIVAPATGRIRPGMTVAGTIESLAPDGRGVFVANGRRVLVLGAWPGDRVEAIVRRRRKGEIHAEATAVLSEGTPRRDPPCVHVTECGGCRWQQWPIATQREAKRNLVARALSDAVPGIAFDVRPALAVSDEFGYRNKMEFTFGTDRADGRVMLGLHRAGRFDRTFDLARCWIASPRASEVVAIAREWANRAGLPAYDGRSHAGLLRHLVVREAFATGEMMVALIAASGDLPALDTLVGDLGAVPGIASILLGVNTRKGDAATPEETRVLAGRETIREKIGRFDVEIALPSFIQTNPVGAARLYDVVAEEAALSGGERVLDLFCGTGLIGLWLADRAREVVGIEQVPEAIGEAERLRDRAGIAHARFVAGNAEDVLPAWAAAGERFDSVVTDPPRSGMHPKAREALLVLAPPRIVYVSCNPAALAADLAILVAHGYRPGPVRPVDMFPQTAHVESVVRLDRAEGP